MKLNVKAGFSPIFREYWINKGHSVEESNRLAYNARSNNGTLSVCSKIETKFLNLLESILQKPIDRNHYLTLNGTSVIPDGKIGKYIIEFNGTNPHCDPRFYSSNDTNGFGNDAEDIWGKR